MQTLMRHQSETSGHQKHAAACDITSWRLLLLVGFIFLSLLRSLSAGPPASWEVMRIYVREDEVGTLVPRDYSPVEIEDLAAALKREEARRNQVLLESPRIADAFYVAHCTLDHLTSSQSRWQIVAQQNDASMLLGDLSCALKTAATVPVEDQSLIRNLRFSVDGQAELSGITTESNYWFGFSCSPTEPISQQFGSQQAFFQVRVPPATLGRMLISAPENVQLSSPDVVVVKITNPKSMLPENWPVASFSEGSELSWYMVHISGQSEFRLQAESVARKDAFAFEKFLRNAVLTYDVTPSGLTVVGQFSVERGTASRPISLLVDKSLRIKTITVAGQPIEWRTDMTDEKFARLQLVPDDRINANFELRVECLGVIPMPFDTELPALSIERSFTWAGTTNLTADPEFVIEEVTRKTPGGESGRWRPAQKIGSTATTAEQALAVTVDDKARTGTAADRKQWTANWVGVAPPSVAYISRATFPLRASSLTRVMLQSNWIAATTHLQVTAKQLYANELKMRVGQGWFVDGVTIEQSNFPINYQLPDGKSGEILLNWERVEKDLTVKLRISAHLPQNTDVDRLGLQAPRVISVPGAEHEDVYAVEQPAGFRIQSDPLVNRLILRNTELPTWQSQLLAPTDLVLLRGVRATLPQLIFRRSSGSYSSKIQTIGKAEAGQLRVEYLLEVQPLSGAIDRLSCLLNVPTGIVPPTWSLVRDNTKLTLPVVQSMVSSNREEQTSTIDGETLYEIQLPESTAEKFTLRSELMLPVGDDHIATVPLLSSTGAVSTDAILAIPRRFSLIHSSVGIESLPSSICCSSGELATVLGNLGASMVAYRYDPGSVSTVDLLTTDSESKARSWAWSSQVDHWLFNDGQMGHTCQWQIFAPESGKCSIELPTGWSVEQLLLDGEVVEISTQSQMQKIAIELPPSERLLLKLQCSSYTSSPKWLTDVTLVTPVLSMESLNTSERLWLQPSKLTVAEVLSAPGPSLSASLIPQRWWHWLTPDFIQGNSLDAVSVSPADMPPGADRWNPVTIVRPVSGSAAMEDRSVAEASIVRVIDRGSLSGFCLAALLAGGAICFVLFGSRVWLWWSSITITLASIVLLPDFYAIATHLILLSLISGALARLICVISRSRSNSSSTITQRGSTFQRTVVTSALLIGLALPVGNGRVNMACGQEPAERIPSSDSGVFGVIIPLNKQGEVSAKHVYAPRKLMNLLENPDSDAATNQPPQLLGAKYFLKLRGGTSLTTSYVQEFTAEFDVQFDSSDSELRLPFKATQVQLLRGFVFGQEVYIGSRLKQSADSISYYPDEPGRVRLRLQLIPKQVEDGERTSLDVSIPNIATASLEVLTDDALDVKIASQGEVRRGVLNNLEADLGPVSQLRLDWPTRPQRTPIPNQSQISADTWLQIQDRQLLADCQLRIEGGESLPKQLHLIADAGWEPVGSAWNDVQLISSELSTIGNRRIYRVTRTKQADATIIRVLMIPKNLETATTVNIPLLSLQEASLTNRTLAIATSKNPGWKITGAELWSRLPMTPSELQWDATKLNQQPLIMRVPSGTISAALQRLPDSSPNLVAESNIVTFINAESLISYRAAWPQVSSEKPILRLLTPAAAKVQEVKINGMDAEYQLVQRGNQHLLLVSVDSARVLQQLDVRMKLPARIGKAEHLPRIVLEDHTVVSSDYQVRCGAELSCRFISAPNVELELLKPAKSANDMLANMAAGVGKVELSNAFRDSAQLPVQFELRKKSPVRIEENVMLLARTEQGWKATVETWLRTEDEPIDFVFFEIPTGLRELIEPNELAYSISNSLTSNRATLCVIPKETIAGLTRVAFDFRLPVVGSSQSISIPDVQLLSGAVDRPILALPNQIENQAVRWSRVGRRLNDDWMTRSTTTYAPGDFVFYQLSDNQLQASWSPATLDTKRPEVLYSTVHAIEQPDHSFVGAIDYWLDPQNLLELGASVPVGCELVGIQAGGSSAVWRPVVDTDAQAFRQIRILLQPNYLPVHLRMFVKWSRAEPMERSTAANLRLPSLDTTGSKQISFALKTMRPAQVQIKTAMETEEELGQGVTQEAFVPTTNATQVAADAALRWKNLLLKSLPTVSDLNSDELASWLQSWSPQVVRLKGDQRFPINDAVDTDKRQYDNVAQFWSWYLEQLDANEGDLLRSLSVLADTEPEIANDFSLQHSDFETTAQHYAPEFDRRAGVTQYLSVRSLPKETVSKPRLSAAALLCLASGLGFWLILRLSKVTLDTLSLRPWLYWAFLAMLVWLILPAVWPSLVIAGSAISLFFSQFFSSQRRSYAGRTA